MNLTREQLTEIKVYIQDMGIKYLDVQMEILDHAACKVEEKMNADSTLSFDDAFYQTTREFGYLEYKEFEKSFAKTIQRKSNNVFRLSLKKWFLSTKIVYIILLAAFFSLLIFHLGAEYATKLLLIIYASSTLFDLQYLLFKYPKYRKFSTIRYSVASVNTGSLILVWKHFIYEETMIVNSVLIIAYTTFSVLYIISIIASYETRNATIARCEKLNQLYNIYS